MAAGTAELKKIPNLKNLETVTDRSKIKTSF